MDNPQKMIIIIIIIIIITTYLSRITISVIKNCYQHGSCIKMSISLRLHPHFEQNMMTTFPKKVRKRPGRVTPRTSATTDQKPLTTVLAFAVSDLFLP